MRFTRQTLVLSITTLILGLALQMIPSAAYQPRPAAPESVSNPTTVLIAARGCLGAEAARGALRAAERNLKDVRRESRELNRAYDQTRDALENLDRHIDRRCR